MTPYLLTDTVWVSATTRHGDKSCRKEERRNYLRRYSARRNSHKRSLTVESSSTADNGSHHCYWMALGPVDPSHFVFVPTPTLPGRKMQSLRENVRSACMFCQETVDEWQWEVVSGLGRTLEEFLLWWLQSVGMDLLTGWSWTRAHVGLQVCVVTGRCSNRGKERKKTILCICDGPDLWQRAE